MPQLRWTLLFLGVVFVILLAWIERRRQRQQGQGFAESAHVEKEPATEATAAPMLREPVFALPEMRAAREPAPPHDLPVVEIEDESLDVAPPQPPESRSHPPTLSLPVVGSGPEVARRRATEPTLSDAELDSMDFTQTDVLAETPVAVTVPRLDKPAPKPVSMMINLADTNVGITGVPDLGVPEPRARQSEAPRSTVPESEVRPSRGPRSGAGAPQPRAPQSGSRQPGPRQPDSEERAFNDAVFGEASLAVEPGIGATLPVGDRGTGVDIAPQAGAPRSSRDAERVSGRAGSTEPDFTDAELAEIAATDPGDVSATAVAPEPTTVPTFTAADVKPIPDPIVDWPPDDQRRLVALRLVATPPERLAGRALRLALASEGFVLGKFQIFHKPDESGRAVLSAANLSKPGTFDLGTMDTQRYGGLSLFAVLPGPKPGPKAFDDLLATARNLNERLQGALQDERGGPLTPTRIATLRESLDAEVS